MIRKNVLFFASVLFLIFINGCCMAPIKTELPLLGSDVALKNSDPGKVKMIIFNNTNNFLFGLDMTGRINIKLDDKAIGGLYIGEYAQLIIPKGKHRIELVHLDMTYFTSYHDLVAEKDPLIVEIWATPVSNALWTLDDLPPNFINNFTPYKPVD